MIKQQTEKLQKVLAKLGLGSRREIEGWIADGRIQVNGQVATLGIRVSEQDEIQLDGKVVSQQLNTLKTRVILYHKPPDEICTRHDPEGRRTVYASLPPLEEGRWISVGRLDLTTTGLLLFTNDGELANRLMHPSAEIEREYLVRVRGELTKAMQVNLLKGVKLDVGFAKFKSIKQHRSEGLNHWYSVVLMEGKNREVRKLFESQGLLVSRLKRIRYGDIVLPLDLQQGDWCEVLMPPRK